MPPGAAHLSERNAQRSYVKIEPPNVTIDETANKPKISQLQALVSDEIKRSSFWERRGADFSQFVVTFCAMLPFGLYLMTFDNLLVNLAGLVCLTFVHASGWVKFAHSFGHNAYGLPEWLNKILIWFNVEFVGAFPAKITIEDHVKIHHPHTNIIGLGDSSIWKMPQLSRTMYMVVAPFFLPILIPLVATVELLHYKYYIYLIAVYLPSQLASYYLQFYVLSRFVGMGTISASLYILMFRGLLAPSFIHVNIFQHIGLSMYSNENRPGLLVLMSTAVLNLNSNWLLDAAFGHALISCHTEHHLFPKLTDRMCLKVKPIVKKFFEENGLPYFESTYSERFWYFMNNYEQLMVDAPPITHFVAVR